MDRKEIRGRFAPSPSGRMHLGNLFAALLAWLDVRRLGGTMVLRMEDLDPERCREAFAVQLAEDLDWLGLDWDEGYGVGGGCGPYRQSRRTERYAACFARLAGQHRVYPCYCSRAERLAASAPHRGDNRDLYGGRCRRLTPEERAGYEAGGRRPAWRIAVPDETVSFSDGVQGARAEHLPTGCGDFILRRADGVYAYQLAAAADDGAMGITRVVRGEDLLSSTPRQIWLMGALGHRPPAYCHVPLLLAGDGRRLSKRDGDLDMGALRERFTPEELTGRLAHLAGLLPEPRPVRPAALIAGFSWARVPARDIVLPDRLRDGLRGREAPPGPVDKPFSL